VRLWRFATAGLSALGMTLAAGPAAAADFTWSGAQGPFDTKWSTGANWAGGVAPSGAAGTLTFPATACRADSCRATDDVPGLAVSQLAIVAPVGTGGMPPPNSWTLESTEGLTRSSGLTSALQSTGEVAVGGVALRLPIVLGGPNTWTLGPQSLTAIAGDVSGAAQPLAVDVARRCPSDL
jgi:hypothetical protein